MCRVIIREDKSIARSDTNLMVHQNSWTCTSWSKCTAHSGMAKLNKVCTASMSSCVSDADGASIAGESTIEFVCMGMLYSRTCTAPQWSCSAICLQTLGMSCCLKLGRWHKTDSIFAHKKAPQSQPLSCRGVFKCYISPYWVQCCCHIP